MDIELLKTFLEVSRTRHFGKAAENLFVTQAAVSSRIRQLEEVLGVQLFTRARNNIQLTSAGHRLVTHAETVVNGWNRARQEVASHIPEARPLAVGGLPSLWDAWLAGWASETYREIPGIALSLEALSSMMLTRRLRERSLDLVFVYEPLHINDFESVECLRFDLVLVSTEAHREFGKHEVANYVFVDWGTAFGVRHSEELASLIPAMRVDLPSTAIRFIREHGGAAYLAEPMIRQSLERGDLHRVAHAPTMQRSIHAIFPTRSAQADIVRKALALLAGPIAQS